MMTPAHIALLRLLAKQAVASHLTAQTKQPQGEAQSRQNPPALQQAAGR